MYIFYKAKRRHIRLTIVISSHQGHILHVSIYVDTAVVIAAVQYVLSTAFAFTFVEGHGSYDSVCLQKCCGKILISEVTQCI